MRNTLTYNGMTFENARIKAAEMAVDTSLNQRTLDVDTMHATVKSEIALTTFQQNTPVRFLRGGSQYALWYLSQITRVAPQLYELSMISSLGRLSQMEHRGGVYSGVAASTIIDEICGVVPHYVQPAFQNVKLYGWLPYVAPSGENGAQTGSAKDNLLQVLFALNATVRDDADGTLRIENLSTSVSSTIGASRIYREGASVVYEPTVTAVTVLEHQFIAGGDETLLFEGTTTAGQIIVFREPMSNLVATGFTITASNANYAVVSAGSGTLTGQAYTHITREITKSVASANIPNVARIEDATLVGLTNSNDVADRLVEFYKHRTWINVDALVEYEDAGDVVSIYDPFDKVMRQACIEKISPLIVSQTMKGSISALVGFTPWQVVPFEDVRVLLTGSGTWTVPTGVTEITAVLIGGGDGGSAGEAGTAGGRSALILTSSETDVQSFTRSSSPGEGGMGGAGGTAGEGGNILRVELTVTPGQTFSYAAGSRGASGASGTASTFGTYSSASGAASGIGYTDPVTGDTYALPGTDGAKGGDGGKGGTPSSFAGDDGEDAGANTGGKGGAGHSFTGNITRTGVGYIGTRTTAECGAGGGGAASPGANGSDGTSSTGGRGASATTPAQKTVYGEGGDGGAGGGGGGGAGALYISVSMESGYTYSSQGYWATAAGGSGGSGADGGAGAPGCCILYYRVPVTS